MEVRSGQGDCEGRGQAVGQESGAQQRATPGRGDNRQTRPPRRVSPGEAPARARGSPRETRPVASPVASPLEISCQRT